MGRGGVVKRSVAIAGHRTSVSLEEPFWAALTRIAVRRAMSVQALVAEIDNGRGDSNLSSAIRVHVLESVTQESVTRESVTNENVAADARRA